MYRPGPLRRRTENLNKRVRKFEKSSDDGARWGDGTRPDDGMDSDDGSGRSPSRRGGCASSRLDHGLKVELDPYIKGPKKTIFPSFFYYFFVVFPYIWPLAGPNIAKKVGRYKNWRGVIDKPILELLTFGPNLDFSDFVSKTNHFDDFLTGKAQLSSRDQVGC